jgi:adenosylcobinamide kinase / adenosylcobinamide-phosphate guanylyltransferase
MKGRMIIFLGGIRSGKSRLAEERYARELKKHKLKGVYLATVDSRRIRGDHQMQQRILEHKKRRPASWETLEIGRDLAAHGGHPAMLLDGLSLWVALRLADPPEAVVQEATDFALQASTALAVLVLDEVGQGGVSASRDARRFVDLNGRINQEICAAAHEVWRVDAGIAVQIR